MALHESGENYLETILVLEERLGKVRSIDVANEHGYSRASISRAVGILKKDGLLVVADDGALVLTRAGRLRAEAVYERHRTIADYLSKFLGVDKTTALEDACRIEHILSDASFTSMKEKLATPE
ncbi:MAG: metal-dependent transcriptional regulator [Clostridiales Family XIII bacterium]|jgi:Mn-dependent DtxR family transcriptional regulator|nr:metal-dependent transcriptional regulator [Clostridiales Family XIII bacterium]